MPQKRSARIAQLNLAILLLFLSGCTHFKEYCSNGFKVGPNYGRPGVEMECDWIDQIPQLRREATDAAQWWLVFNDPVLDELILEGYGQNIPLRQAGSRILEARAIRSIAVGGLFPQTQQAFGAYTHNLRSNRAVTIPSPDRTFSNWQTGLNLSWEVDLWGRYRRQIEASSADLDANIEAYDGVLVTLLGDIASTYVEIRTTQRRLTLARQNVEALGGSRNIADKRFEAGATSEVDVLQAQTILSQTEALIPALAAQLRIANNRLCVLLGRPPEDLVVQMPEAGIPNPPASVAVGMPADLLRRRPDVRQAERQLAAQCARIGIAETDLYPRLSINGQVGVQAQQFDDLFRNGAGFGTVGPSFTWNIFNYGRLLNAIEIQDARFQQIARNYEQRVLIANQEVENASIQFFQQQLRVRALAESVNAAQKSSNLIVALYREGKADYNRVFNVQSTLVIQQDLLAQSQGDISQALVQLYRAMGGGWQIRMGRTGSNYCEGCDCVKLGCEDDYIRKCCPVCPPPQEINACFDVKSPACPCKTYPSLTGTQAEEIAPGK